MIRRYARSSIVVALVLAGCAPAAPIGEAPGIVWSRTHDAVDSLGALGRIDEAIERVAAARMRADAPRWLTGDLAATEASLRRRATLPTAERNALQAADAGVARVAAMSEHDSLLAAHTRARQVCDVRIAACGIADPSAARARLELANVAFRMGRGGEADSIARDVLAQLANGDDTTHALAGSAEQLIGRVIKNFSGARYRTDALAHYERALTIRTRTDGPRSLAVAELHHDLGNLERQAKRVPDAIAHFEQALAIRRERLGPHHEDVASTLSAIAWLSASQGDWKGAERRVRESLAAVPEAKLTSPSVIALRFGLLGQALRRTGRAHASIAPLQTAVAAAESVWTRVPHDGAGSVSAGLIIHRELGLALAAEGRAEEAFAEIERSQLRLWSPGMTDDAWSHVLARVQRVLPRDAALVMWPRTSVLPPGGDYPMWGCVVRSTGRPAWVRIDRTAGWPDGGVAPREALNRELAFAADWPLRVTDTHRADSLAAVMGREILTPLEPHLAGVSRLIVSGPDLMAWTPLGMMRDAHGARLDERFAISYVPSALAYADLCERASRTPPVANERALLVGAPDPGRDDAVRWPSLAGAADELRGLAHVFPEATVLTGREATAGRLDAMARSGALEPYGVLHFAAHIDLVPDRVRESSFVLSPDTPGDPHSSRLHAARIADAWRVHARLVSLAGCSSALGLYSASEGWQGMHTAFFAAGAPCLLVSLWRVDDEATRRLMLEFHTRLLARDGPHDAAQALRAAQRAVREYRAPDGRAPFAHPVYWAGFALVGRG